MSSASGLSTVRAAFVRKAWASPYSIASRAVTRPRSSASRSSGWLARSAAPASSCLDVDHPIEHGGQLLRKRRAGAESTALRPLEAHAVSMQEHPREPELAHPRVGFRIAVLVIARHRMAGVRGVHADLMGAAG